MPPVSMLGGKMNKRIKRILALMLACTIVIGSVNNARFESRASAAGIIAGGIGKRADGSTVLLKRENQERSRLKED